MPDHITITGFVATNPRHIVTSEGLAITSFRLASPQSRYDRKTASWVEKDANWYTVSCFRQLALNAVASIHQGQRVLVNGRLRIRDWESGDRSGTNVEVEADALGHDLNAGTSEFTKVSNQTPEKSDGESEYPQPEESSSSQDGAQVAWAS